MQLSRRALLALMFVATLAVPAAAQDGVTLMFYIVPGERADAESPLVPKYFDGIDHSAIKYGPEHFLVAAVTTPAQHDVIAAQSDAFVIPGLELIVGGNPALNQIRNRLAALGIPNSYITASTTWREIVTRTGHTALVIGRMRGGLGRRIFDNGVNLGSTLSVSLRDEFILTAQSLAVLQRIVIDTTGITTDITVQEALLLIGDQLKPFILAGEIF
jgi:hypothetical protein